MKKLTDIEFINRCNVKHNNKYDYSLVNYSSSGKKVDIICKIHGKFTMVANSHILGRGCSDCFYSKLSEKMTKSKEFFLEQLFSKFPGKFNDYNFSLFEYVGTKKASIVTCKNGHTVNIRPDSLLNGTDCHICSREKQGWSYSAWCKRSETSKSYIYIFEIKDDSEHFLKIGRTLNLYSRYKNIKSNYNIIKVYVIEDAPSRNFHLEYEIHNKYKSYKYLPTKWCSGFTECFDVKLFNIIMSEYNFNEIRIIKYEKYKESNI